jgi:hypothetical protein
MDPQFEFVPARTSHMSAPAHGGKEFNRALADLTNQQAIQILAAVRGLGRSSRRCLRSNRALRATLRRSGRWC